MYRKAMYNTRFFLGSTRIVYGFCLGVSKRLFLSVLLWAFGTGGFGRYMGSSRRYTGVFRRVRVFLSVGRLESLKSVKNQQKNSPEHLKNDQHALEQDCSPTETIALGALTNIWAAGAPSLAMQKVAFSLCPGNLRNAWNKSVPYRVVKYDYIAPANNRVCITIDTRYVICKHIADMFR